MAEYIKRQDDLNTGRIKINEELTKSNNNADKAKIDSAEALNIANQSIHQSQSTQDQLNQVIIDGDSSVEAAAARVDEDNITHTTLKERIDDGFTKTKTQLAQNTTDYLGLGNDLEGGTFDNAEALKELIINVKSEGKSLYVPNGKYYVNDDIVIEGILNIVFDGEIIIGEGKTLTIVGGRGSESYTFKARRISGEGKLRLVGYFNSESILMGASYLELYANGDLDYWHRAMAYNEIKLGRIEKFSIFSEGDERGWINENTFYGGRIFDLFIGGNYPHNHNVFYNPKIENGKIEIQNGAHNRMYDVRLEGENEIKFGENAVANRILNSWNGNSPSRAYTLVQSSPFEDLGVGNDVINTNLIDLNLETILDINSEQYNMELFNKNGESINAVATFQNILDTGIFEIDKNFGVNLKSDESLFRLQVFLYDENKNPIQDDTAIDGTAIEYFSGGYYGTRFNVMDAGFGIFKNKEAKYFRIRVQNGDGTLGMDFKNLRIITTVKKSETIGALLQESKIYNRMLSNRKPTETDFRRGKIVYHGAPLDGRDISWTYDGNGNWLSNGKLGEG